LTSWARVGLFQLNTIVPLKSFRSVGRRTSIRSVYVRGPWSVPS
jgi:hypothetical protein